ncbi:thymidine phosphorylase [Pleomorphomonas carboxyditropha]|uniref:Thymidine phosphorylase n=1 Tax=Pleomorphomonas carboxyditropha TaxID=2023338 RepID=A0A2G9WUQ4_9HYPH|nr:thymidine phosphorylase [Pleomorphomonas carboxyditropha]PIO98427.1 thymidine phosphorylase [Pleomorphomonas carboxyditropha]
MSFLPQEIIRRKRDGAALGRDEIAFMVEGLTVGSVTEGQVAAFAMATFFRGMTIDERVALTLAMRDSGVVLDWSDLPGPALDKHSTGGIGDTVSLMLAPAVAACGGFVPMISGRGLGHTGGTLDKLDAVPGYRTQPDNELFRKVVREVGCAIIGQTTDLAPADKRLYAIRDVTGTVESIDLITASILSKKLAAGLHGLVLDVKTGTGAFMASLEDSRALAESLVSVANGAGLPTIGLITDMHEPLGTAAGNALEVQLAVDFLTGRRIDPRMWEVTVALAAEMLVIGGLRPDLGEARVAVEEALTSGRAAEIFGSMVSALGGPIDFVMKADTYLAKAPVVKPVPPPQAGTVAAIDARAIGVAVVGLGGGRTRPQDAIDPSVGFSALAGRGEDVGPDRPLGFVHAASESAADAAAAALVAAYRLGDRPERGPSVVERVGG